MIFNLSFFNLAHGIIVKTNESDSIAALYAALRYFELSNSRTKYTIGALLVETCDFFEEKVGRPACGAIATKIDFLSTNIKKRHGGILRKVPAK